MSNDHATELGNDEKVITCYNIFNRPKSAFRTRSTSSKLAKIPRTSYELKKEKNLSKTLYIETIVPLAKLSNVS